MKRTEIRNITGGGRERTWFVYQDGKNVATFKTRDEARRYLNHAPARRSQAGTLPADALAPKGVSRD